jgi:hypothetical protein
LRQTTLLAILAGAFFAISGGGAIADQASVMAICVGPDLGFVGRAAAMQSAGLTALSDADIAPGTLQGDRLRGALALLMAGHNPPDRMTLDLLGQTEFTRVGDLYQAQFAAEDINAIAVSGDAPISAGQQVFTDDDGLLVTVTTFIFHQHESWNYLTATCTVVLPEDQAPNPVESFYPESATVIEHTGGVYLGSPRYVTQLSASTDLGDSNGLNIGTMALNPSIFGTVDPGILRGIGGVMSTLFRATVLISLP